MSIPQRSKLLQSLRQWKTKAIARREQIEALKNRVGKLTDSRDSWKKKADAWHGRVTSLQATMRGLRAEAATLRDDVAEFQATCTELQGHVARLYAENQQLRPSSDASKKNAPARYQHSLQTIQTGVLNHLFPLLEGNSRCQTPAKYDVSYHNVVLFAFS